MHPANKFNIFSPEAALLFICSALWLHFSVQTQSPIAVCNIYLYGWITPVAFSWWQRFPCSISLQNIHPSSVTILSLFFNGVVGVFAGANPSLSLGEGRVLPGQVASSSQGPHWWQRPPCKVPTTHQEQLGAQYLPQGDFVMQLSSARSWDLNQRASDH